MTKIHVQFIVGNFTVNHVVTEGALEDVRANFFKTWKEKLKSDAFWLVEDSAIRPSAIQMIRVCDVDEETEADGK